MKQVTVNNQVTLLEELEILNRQKRLCVHLENEGNVNLSSFAVSITGDKDLNYIPLYNQSTDWTAPPFTSLIRLSGSEGSADNPVTLAAGESFFFYLEDISAFYSIKFEASTSADETTINISVTAGE